MIIFNPITAFASTRPIQHLSMGFLTTLLAAMLLLSGCQPSDSLSADQKNNTQGNNDQPVSNDAVGAIADDDSFSDIMPTYVEGLADVPADICENETVVNAFKSQQSDRQVKGCGTVIKALPDDNAGSRHQQILVLQHFRAQHLLFWLK